MASSSIAEKARAKKAKRRAGPAPTGADDAAGTGAALPVLVQNIEMIAVNRVGSSLLNRSIDEDDPRFLAIMDSIGRMGLQSPIAVRPRELHPADGSGAGDPGYEIVFGERRWRACRRLGHAFIAATVHAVDERRAHLMRMAENREQQSLTDLEEADAVASLLSLCGDDYSAAAELGATGTWVRRRARLCNLSGRWRTALADPDTPYPRIRDSVERKEELALLPEAEQDRLLDDGGLRWSCGTTAAMRGFIRKFLRRLDARPWPEEFESGLDTALDCDFCAKRSDSDGDLFAGLDEKPADKSAFCLDSGCWAKKTGMWLKTVLKEARARAKREGLGGAARLMPGGYVSGRELAGLAGGLGGEKIEAYDPGFTESVKIDDADRGRYGPPQLVVFASGPRTGQIVEGCFRLDEEEPEDGGEDGGRPAGSGIDYREMMRRNEERRRKSAAFTGAVRKLIPRELKKDDAALLTLVRWYGYSSNDIYNGNRALLPPVKNNPRAALWKAVLDRLFSHYGTRDRGDGEREALCEFLGVDTDAAEAEAALALAAEEAEEAEEEPA